MKKVSDGQMEDRYDKRYMPQPYSWLGQKVPSKDVNVQVIHARQKSLTCMYTYSRFLTCIYKKGGKGGTVHYLKVKKKISSAVLGKIFPMHSYVKFTDSMWSHPTP